MKKLIQRLRWWFFMKYKISSKTNYINGQAEYYQKYYEMMKERENDTN